MDNTLRGWVRTTVQALVASALTAGPVMEALDRLGVAVDRAVLVSTLTAAVMSVWWRVGTAMQTSDRRWVSALGRWLMGGPPPIYR